MVALKSYICLIKCCQQIRFTVQNLDLFQNVMVYQYRYGLFRNKSINSKKQKVEKCDEIMYNVFKICFIT